MSLAFARPGSENLPTAIRLPQRHPLATGQRGVEQKFNPPRTPVLYAYENEAFIPVKCKPSPLDVGYCRPKTPYFAVTGKDGSFTLPDIPPAAIPITAWHETLGTKSEEYEFNTASIRNPQLHSPQEPEIILRSRPSRKTLPRRPFRLVFAVN